jgi:hypothetical protein
LPTGTSAEYNREKQGQKLFEQTPAKPKNDWTYIFSQLSKKKDKTCCEAQIEHRQPKPNNNRTQ